VLQFSRSAGSPQQIVDRKAIPVYLGMTNDTGERHKNMYVYAEQGLKGLKEG
jgi:hypothetical protein